MVTIQISGGLSYQVNWVSGMNGQSVLEAAYNVSTMGDFTFSLQYYGSSLGYLVDMVNETYDTFISKYEPYFFWEFLVNGNPSQKGIDNTMISDGDVITFEFTTYNAVKHAETTLQSKYKLKKMQFSEN